MEEITPAKKEHRGKTAFKDTWGKESKARKIKDSKKILSKEIENDIDEAIESLSER